MHEIMFALGDLPKIIFKVHFVAGPTLKKYNLGSVNLKNSIQLKKSIQFFGGWCPEESPQSLKL